MKSHYILNKVWGLLLMLLVSLSANAQTNENILVVKDFEAVVGKTVDVPIYLNNSDEVVAAQFDIQLPFNIPSNATAILSNRSNQHSASFSSLGKQLYRVVVMSMQNLSLRGNAGLLLRLPMQTTDDGKESYPIFISNIVLTNVQGDNIATDKSASGNFIVYRGSVPDLTISSITPQVKECQPGGEFKVDYTIENIGTGPTGAGWTEKIYLQASNGVRTFVGSLNYASVLSAGNKLSRSYSGSLPSLLHIEGDVRVVVEIVPHTNTGELLADQGNNTSISDNQIFLGKRLFLSTDRNTVREGSNYALVTLSRSGDWSLAETFTIDCPVKNLFTCNGMTMPCKVTIPSRSSGTTLRIASVDDKIVRAREADITISAENGYQSVSLMMKRVDNDRNPLSLFVSPSSVNEGEKLTLSAERGGELTDELTLQVGCSHASRFDQPFVLNFGVGQSTASTTVMVINDDTPQLDANVRFSVSSADYQSAYTSLKLLDDDRPSITLKLSRSSIVENEGSDAEAQPLIATIHRDRGVGQAVTIWLTSSSNEVVFEKNKVTIPADQEEVSVPISVTDNSIVDGQRTVNLSAALYLPSELKAAPIGDRARSQEKLTIIDDESPYLMLSSRVNAIGEGSSTLITVRRYVPNPSAPLTVTLSCDDSRVSFKPQPVTIPAGSYTATTSLSVERNAQENDDSDILITAKAADMVDGQLQLHITDRTLPDAVNPSIECVGAPFYSGLPAKVRATIRNYGTSVLPKGMTIDFYLASNSRLSYYTTSTNFFQATTDKDIMVGGEETFEFEAQLPQLLGNQWVYARLNADKHIQEFSTGNNLTQQFCPITIAAPFEVETITASPDDCLPGGVVTVQGRMKAVEGSALNHQTVRIILEGNGQRSSQDTQIDVSGNFTATVNIDRSASGYLTVKALALGQTEPAKTTRIHVYNMSLSANTTRWTVDENIEQQGFIRLRNMSGKTISINEFTVSQPLPEGATVTFDTQSLSTIAAGATVNIPYTVKGSKPSSKWQQFTVTAKSTEGLVAQLPIHYYCQATNAHLVFTPRELKTTMLFNADRENVAVTVKNCGKKATGKISELISDDWVMSDFGNNRVIEPGESVTFHLNFLAREDMHTGRTYKSYLQLTPDNGSSAGLPISVTTTGSEYSQFDVFATDVYSKAEDDFTYVSGATVTVTHARSGSVVMTGTTDANGHWMTQTMQEGLYNVTVRANRHKTVTTQVAIGPGEDKSINVLLPYKAFLADFVVDRDLEENTYTMKQFFNIDLLAPQAVVVAEISDNGFGCGSDLMEVKLTNVGTAVAHNIRLFFPVVAGYSFVQENAMPTMMQPGDTHVLIVRHEGPTTGNHRVISTMRMHYEFDVKGETLSEDDDYQTLVGCCESDDAPLPTVSPTPPADPENPEGGDDDTGGKGGITGAALPTTGCVATLEFENLTDVHCGQPIHAVLTVKNGQSAALRQLRFTSQVSDAAFEDKTALFKSEEGDASGFEVDGAYRKLDGQKEGQLYLTFIPQADAAANGPETYYIGGQLSYIDAHTNIRNTASLPLLEVTVLPVGDVQLTYLIQRNFLSDEVETEETENAEPTMFAILAHNMSPATVAYLKMSSSQPVVVGNRSSKAIAYTNHYAGLNGIEGNNTFADFELEYLEGGGTAAAQWIYSSEISAHVQSMNTITRHAMAAAGSGASVVLGTPRELIRAVATPGKQLPTVSSDLDELSQKVLYLSRTDAYLLNDVDDENSLPDAVITADGSESSLQVVSATSRLTALSATGNYQLVVRANQAGWIYGQLHDPTNGLMMLESVTRQSDGQNVSLANFWQSNRTPQSDYTMTQENLLHFADQLRGSEETYQLHFVARPDADVRLLNVGLFTASGSQVADGATTTAPVKKIVVEFTAPIKRLYYNYVMLTAHDEIQDMSNAPLSSESDNRRWMIDLSPLAEVPGEHTLTINANRLKSPSGNKVVGTSKMSWTEQISGAADITINVAPNAQCGHTNPESGLLAYGKQRIKAVPSEGYRFDRWTEGDDNATLSTDETLEYTVWKNSTLTAYFSPVTCSIVIECDDHGKLTGNLSGIYSYGEQILLAVQPDPGYEFNGWTCDGKLFSTSLTVTDVVKADHIYKATFRENMVGIDRVQGSSMPTNIYSLTGVCVAHKVTDVQKTLRSLPAGIYIVGGKKVIKK